MEYTKTVNWLEINTHSDFWKRRRCPCIKTRIVMHMSKKQRAEMLDAMLVCDYT